MDIQYGYPIWISMISKYIYIYISKHGYHLYNNLIWICPGYVLDLVPTRLQVGLLSSQGSRHDLWKASGPAMKETTVALVATTVAAKETLHQHHQHHQPKKSKPQRLEDISDISVLLLRNIRNTDKNPYEEAFFWSPLEPTGAQWSPVAWKHVNLVTQSPAEYSSRHRAHSPCESWAKTAKTASKRRYQRSK
jgi:hypothetical protein